MPKKVLITSALPYANGPLHFGHIAGAYLPADCYVRFQRLIGNDVIYICGSDEYGIAITLSAEMAGRSPQEHVDKFHKINKFLFEKLNISFDHFSRTTTKEHIPLVQKFFLDLYNNGFIEEKEKEHLYSEEEDRFLADRYVLGTCPKCGFEKARGDECPKCAASFDAKDLKNPVSRLSNKPLTLKKSTHWYMRFDKFKDRLLKWVKDKKWKPNVYHFTLSYIEDLKERAITRDSAWGVPLPLANTEGKVLYVWFDAPIGYISATQDWSNCINQPDKWKEYWLDKNTKLVNFIGKDNIPFHTVFFPAMIMGQNEPYILVDDVPANEFFLLEGRQFSKTDKWYIDLDDFFSKYSVDQIRYYLAANAPETSDSEFTWKDFQNKSNSELLGKFGNFIHRILVFAKKNTEGKAPSIHDMDEVDSAFLKTLEEKAKESYEAYDHYHLRKASQIFMELAHAGNVYFDHKKPWVLAKDEKTKPQMETAIALCLNCIKTLALISFPILPDACQKIWQMLGQKTVLTNLNWRDILAIPLAIGQQLNQPKILFQKIEDDQIQKELETLKSGKQS